MHRAEGLLALEISPRAIAPYSLFPSSALEEHQSNLTSYPSHQVPIRRLPEAKAHLSVYISSSLLTIQPFQRADSPLEIRVGLRDHWETANSPVQESISALSDVIGLSVDVTLEAPMLWRELEKHFSDPGHAAEG